jgi:uncharacterized protein YkwD
MSFWRAARRRPSHRLLPAREAANLPRRIRRYRPKGFVLMPSAFSPKGTTSPALFLAAFLSCLVAAATSPAPAAAVVGNCTPGSDWGTSRPDLASQVVTQINSHRTSIGRVALNVSPTLTNAAVWKALHMARYAYMTHDDPAPPIARTVPDRLEACGYPSRTTGWGENIAYGYSSPSSVVQAWLNSAGHRANIENPSYRSTGVGAATNASGVLYWSQEFGTYDDSANGGGGPPAPSAPSVGLTGGPASSTTSTSASFAWTTTGTVNSTSCSLNGAAATACSSPKAYSGLALGSHTFRVTVSNSAGSSSATASWSIVSSTPPATAPTVRFTSTSGSGGTKTFAWSTTGTVTSTRCSLDGSPQFTCSSPWTLTGLRSGSHRFTVYVAGPAGSASSWYSWYVWNSF